MEDLIFLDESGVNLAMVRLYARALKGKSARGKKPQKRGKNLLNNLRLVVQPFVLFNLIRPWLEVFPIPALSVGFSRLIALMNYFNSAVPIPRQMQDFLFSAA